MTKRIVFAGILGLGIMATIMSGCGEKSSPTAATSTDPVGRWVGLTTETRQGTSGPDTFAIDLNVTASAYTMMRTSIVHGSSLGNPDTLQEEGSWAKIGTDSIVFNPTAGSCKRYDFGEGVVVANAKCATPVRLKISISGSTWTAAIPKFTDYDAKLATAMKKQ